MFARGVLGAVSDRPIAKTWAASTLDCAPTAHPRARGLGNPSKQSAYAITWLLACSCAMEYALEPALAPLVALAHVAAIYAQPGKLEEARAEAAEVLRIEPKYTIEAHRRD